VIGENEREDYREQHDHFGQQRAVHCTPNVSGAEIFVDFLSQVITS
jgi:hypothetical protein